MKRAFYDGLPVIVYENSTKKTKGAYVSTGPCPSVSRWVEQSELPANYSERTEETVVVRSQYMSRRVPLSELKFYEEKETQ